MSKPEYTSEQLTKLISEVEKAFVAKLEKAEDLAKSESAAPIVKAEEEHEEKPEHKEEKEEPKDKKDEAPESKDEKHEEPKQEEHAEHSEEKPAAAASDDSCDYDDEDKEHMHKMYLSMSKGELKAHHDACRKALDSHGLEKCGDMSMAKSEETSVTVTEEIQKPNTDVELLKTEVEAQKAKAESLQKTLEAVTAFVAKLAEKRAAPAGKAITSYDAITKSEGFSDEPKALTKNEIDAILLKKSSDPQTPSADRQAINAFYLSKADINTISHLLK